MKSSVGIGVIGMGWMGRVHSRAYRQVEDRFPECRVEPRLSVCADDVEERAREGKERHLFEKYATDWPHKNWWTARNRVANTGFKFYLWDCELTMGLHSDLGTNVTTLTDGVAAPMPACKGNQEFRLLFADHAQKFFGPGGALYVDPENPAWEPEHPERNVVAARFERLARTVDRALVPELHSTCGLSQRMHALGAAAPLEVLARLRDFKGKR